MSIYNFMSFQEDYLRSLIREGIEQEMSRRSRDTSALIQKVIKLSEDLQGAIGRIDDPHSMSVDDWFALRKVRQDVEGSFRHLSVGQPWKVSVWSASGDDEVLGHVLAHSKDDAFEEALTRWGSEHSPNRLVVSPVNLPR